MVRKRLVTALLVCSVILLAAAGTTTAARPAAAAETHGATAAKSPIRHIVVLYLENHSFDSLLGYRCDKHARRCPRGGMPSSVRLSNGVVVKPRHAADVVPIMAHDVNSQLAAMNIRRGVPRMNGWQNIVQGECAAANGYQCISGKPRQMDCNLQS
jgi:hypothetical protein